MTFTGDKRPLVTYLIISYNQEKYIHDAMMAAFSQTYSPLEIMVSDDSSSDNTWPIIKQAVDAYAGNHIVIANRNETNQGITRHVEQVVRRAKGEFIVLAPGDDISFSERTEELVHAWLSGPERPSVICSNGLKIDANGKELGYLVDCDRPRVYLKYDNPFAANVELMGCSSGFERRIYEAFPPVDEDVICEDAITFYRAHLLGGVLYTPLVLVKYRLHEHSASQNKSSTADQYIATFRSWRKERRARIRQYEIDVEHANLYNKSDMVESLSKLKRQENYLSIVLNSNFFTSSFVLFKNNLSVNPVYSHKKELTKMYLYRWLLSFMRKTD